MGSLKTSEPERHHTEGAIAQYRATTISHSEHSEKDRKLNQKTEQLVSEEEKREPPEEPAKIGSALQARLDRIKREFYE